MTSFVQSWYAASQLPAWGTAEAPPTEFLLFSYGANNATMFGGERQTVYLTKFYARAICAEWTRRGIKGHFDFGHELKESAGTFSIERRESGLWVTGIAWTPYMLESFAGKKYQYYSPYFSTTRAKDGKHYITELLNVAITNWPATDNQRPLIALSRVTRNKTILKDKTIRRHTMMDITQAEALAAKVDEYIKSKEYTVQGLAILLMKGDEAPVEDPAMAEDPALAAAAEGETEEEEMTAAVAQVAYTVTGQTGKACIGALKTFSSVVRERDQAIGELRKHKHTAAVELAIKERKITPADRDKALKSDPQEFAGAMAWARPLVSDESYTLTPKSKLTEVETLAARAKELATKPNLIAHCARIQVKPESFAQAWVKNEGMADFTL